MIMPYFDYVDFVIDSATKDKTDLRYNLTSLYQRRVEHLLFFMYKFGKQNIDNLDIQRPKMELRSRNKVKFKNHFTGITKVQNSPFYRGIFLWNQLPHILQHDPELKSFKLGVRLLIKQNSLIFKIR